MVFNEPIRKHTLKMCRLMIDALAYEKLFYS